MKVIRLAATGLLTLTAIALPSCQSAGQAEGGARPFVQTPENPDLAPAVYMKSAEVTARIRSADENDLAKLSTKDKATFAKGLSCVFADVDCFFEMEYAASASSENFGVVFPVFEKSEPPAIIAGFQTWTDGVEYSDLEAMDISVADPSGRSIDYDGYGWPSPAPNGKIQKIRVRYTLILPVHRNKAKFTYVVRSGGTWSKPIGHEIVTVQISQPLQFHSPGKLEPVRKENDRWTWDLKNIRPTDDVEVFIDIPTNRNPGAAK